MKTALAFAVIVLAAAAPTTPPHFFPNNDGDLSCGSCLNNPRTWDNAAEKHSVCSENGLQNCQQAPFPQYYIQKFNEMSRGNATDLCKKAQKSPAKFEGSGMGHWPADTQGKKVQGGVNFLEAARIWFANTDNRAEIGDCVASLRIMSR